MHTCCVSGCVPPHHSLRRCKVHGGGKFSGCGARVCAGWQVQVHVRMRLLEKMHAWQHAVPQHTGSGAPSCLLAQHMNTSRVQPDEPGVQCKRNWCILLTAEQLVCCNTTAPPLCCLAHVRGGTREADRGARGAGKCWRSARGQGCLSHPSSNSTKDCCIRSSGKGLCMVLTQRAPPCHHNFVKCLKT